MNYAVKSYLADLFSAQAVGLKIKDLDKGNSLFCANTVETDCKQPVGKKFLATIQGFYRMASKDSD